MRVCVLSANLGGYDVQVPWVDQVVPVGVSVEMHRFTDENCPPRRKAMTSALQCGIPKMFGWQLVPDADTYIWIDASRGLLRSDTVAWFLQQAGPADLLLFRHPARKTIREEYEFVKAKLAQRSPYLWQRYAGEWLDDQYAAVSRDGHEDIALYASTAFLYRPSPAVKAAFSEWFWHKARYLLHDQLVLPYVVEKYHVWKRVIDDDVYHCAHLPITRVKSRRTA